MRLYPIIPNISFPYKHVLHGHSHLAILGWTFLSVVIIFLTIYWHKLKSKTEAKALIITLFLVTVAMFLTFLYQSYGLYSIIMSTAHIFIEYWTVSFIYRSIKRIHTMPKESKLFIYASLISLVISSIGPFSLGYISSVGLKETFWFDIAIYFYLHFQYNGWLFLFLIGLFLIILDNRKIPIHQPLLRLGFWIYVIALFPNFFASVLWVDHHSFVSTLAAIGTVGQWIAIISILLSFLRARKSLLKQKSNVTRIMLGIIFFILFAKSTMELGLITPGLASLVFETRSVIIGYLHLTLLGFISIFILVQYTMTNVLPINKYTVIGFSIFLLGFTMNELLLFIQSLLTWLNIGTLTFYNTGLLIASLLLLIGIVVLWVAYSEKSVEKTDKPYR